LALSIDFLIKLEISPISTIFLIFFSTIIQSIKAMIIIIILVNKFIVNAYLRRIFILKKPISIDV